MSTIKNAVKKGIVTEEDVLRIFAGLEKVEIDNLKGTIKALEESTPLVLHRLAKLSNKQLKMTMQILSKLPVEKQKEFITFLKTNPNYLANSQEKLLKLLKQSDVSDKIKINYAKNLEKAFIPPSKKVIKSAEKQLLTSEKRLSKLKGKSPPKKPLELEHFKQQMKIYEQEVKNSQRHLKEVNRQLDSFVAKKTDYIKALSSENQVVAKNLFKELSFKKQRTFLKLKQIKQNKIFDVVRDLTPAEKKVFLDETDKHSWNWWCP